MRNTNQVWGDIMTLVVKHYKRPLSSISIGGERVRITPAVLAKFAKPLADRKINFFAIASGEYNLTLFIDGGDTEKATLALTDIVSRSPYSGLSVRRDVGAVSITGPEVLSTPGILHRLLTPIAKERINILAVTTSYDSGFIFFDHSDAERAYTLLSAYIPKKISIFRRAKERAKELVKAAARKVIRR